MVKLFWKELQSCCAFERQTWLDSQLNKRANIALWIYERLVASNRHMLRSILVSSRLCFSRPSIGNASHWHCVHTSSLSYWKKVRRSLRDVSGVPIPIRDERKALREAWSSLRHSVHCFRTENVTRLLGECECGSYVLLQPPKVIRVHAQRHKLKPSKKN